MSQVLRKEMQLGVMECMLLQMHRNVRYEGGRCQIYGRVGYIPEFSRPSFIRKRISIVP